MRSRLTDLGLMATRALLVAVTVLTARTVSVAEAAPAAATLPAHGSGSGGIGTPPNATPSGSPGAAPVGRGPWPGEEMPLPLNVKSTQELAMKALAERQYLHFNLLAGGKVAWDGGDYVTAAQKWDELLKLPRLDPETERIVRPFANEARSRAKTTPLARPIDTTPSPSVPAGIAPAADAASAPAGTGERPRVQGASVSGSVRLNGGAGAGAGGTVVWLRRLDGPMPRTRPGRPKIISQIQKNFVPHIAVVTPGTPVLLRNDDRIYHNVFSPLGPNQFDSGLYERGASYKKSFDQPGPVELLCNIHASMLGWIFVVDSPYFAQATTNGTFKISNVPPGKYQVEAWNEASSKNFRSTVEVGAQGVNGLILTLDHDKRPPRFVPDKYGNPRQPQLGY